jgi:hypothetical protein
MGFPSGTVTLLFTRRRGQHRAVGADPEATAEASARHNRLVREQIETAGGQVCKTVGESFPVMFAGLASRWRRVRCNYRQSGIAEIWNVSRAEAAQRSSL